MNIKVLTGKAPEGYFASGIELGMTCVHETQHQAVQLLMDAAEKGVRNEPLGGDFSGRFERAKNRVFGKGVCATFVMRIRGNLGGDCSGVCCEVAEEEEFEKAS